MTTQTLDIVIPLYNEEKAISKSVETLISFLKGSDFPYDWKITLANNASTDSSWDVCTTLARTYPNIQAYDLGAKGKGLAIRTAWQKSSADIVAFMDTDLSSDLGYFKKLVDMVALEGNDLSIGSRLGKDSKVISNKKLRKLMSQVYNLLVRTFLDTPFDDHQCGFKAMKGSSFMKILPRLQEDGLFFDTELIAVSLRAGLRVVSLDIVWRDSDESKVSVLRDTTRMFGDIFRLRRRLRAKK